MTDAKKAYSEWAEAYVAGRDHEPWDMWDCWRAACRWRAQRDAEIANAHCVSEVCNEEDHGHDGVVCGQWIKQDAGL